MSVKNLIVIVIFFPCAHAMNRSLDSIIAHSEHQQYVRAMQKINTIVDDYLERNKLKDSVKVEDIRLKQPLVAPWCPPSKEGLVLEILSKVQIKRNFLRYSIRTPWGLVPLIESNNIAKPERQEVFPNIVVGQSSFKSCHHESLEMGHFDFYDKEKCLILEVEDIQVMPAS